MPTIYKVVNNKPSDEGHKLVKIFNRTSADDIIVEEREVLIQPEIIPDCGKPNIIFKDGILYYIDDLGNCREIQLLGQAAIPGPPGPRGLTGPIGPAGSQSETGESGIVAFAGGGQAGAYQLTARNSRVDTVATDGDSVKFLPATLQLKQTVQNNDATEAMDVYPSLGDAFLGQAVNNPYSVAAGNQLTIYVYDAGILTPI